MVVRKNVIELLGHKIYLPPKPQSPIMTKGGILRVEIFPELVTALKVEAAIRGIGEKEFVNTCIRDGLSERARGFMTQTAPCDASNSPNPQKEKAHLPQSSKAPILPEVETHIPQFPDAPNPQIPKAPKLQEEKSPAGKEPRHWHGGPPPYEERHPEIAARVLAMWAGGAKKGGMGRNAVTKALRAEGVEITEAIVSQITIRARKKQIQ